MTLDEQTRLVTEVAKAVQVAEQTAAERNPTKCS
jgi:hypothetical protein